MDITPAAIAHDGISEIRWELTKVAADRRAYFGREQVAIDASGCLDAPNDIPSGCITRAGARRGPPKVGRFWRDDFFAFEFDD